MIKKSLNSLKDKSNRFFSTHPDRVDLAKGLAFGIYVISAIAIIAVSVAMPLIPYLLGMPVVVWLVIDLFTAAGFQAPSPLGFALFGAIYGVLTLGNWVYEKLSINPKKTLETREEISDVANNNVTLVSKEKQTLTLQQSPNQQYAGLFVPSLERQQAKDEEKLKNRLKP